MARPARAIRRSQRRSASTIAIFIRTSSVGGTHSIGTESQCSVGQMRRGGRPPHRFSIILISRPVMICPQTRQYRFSSRKCHSQNSSSFLKTCSFSASDNLIEEARSIAKSSFCTKCGTIRRAPDWHISQNRRTRLIRAETSSTRDLLTKLYEEVNDFLAQLAAAFGCVQQRHLLWYQAFSFID
jgi:hypothetical protein